LSIATWVTPYPPSQSRNASSSAVVVPNVRTCCSRTLVRHARDHGLLVDVQSAAALDHPLHGGTSPAKCAGARRSVLLTTLLGVLDGNNAESRQLQRQFWRGLVEPNLIDVAGRRRRGH